MQGTKGTTWTMGLCGCNDSLPSSCRHGGFGAAGAAGASISKRLTDAFHAGLLDGNGRVAGGCWDSCS